MARATTFSSSVLLLAIALTCGLVDAAARSATLEEWFRDRKLANCWRDNTSFLDQSLFLDNGDRVFLRDIPNTDYSGGGVHFFGTSNLSFILAPWRYPPEVRDRVGNFSLGGATHTDQLHLIRYLAQDEELLANGKETLVVLGLFYGNAIHARKNRFARLFPDKCERYGLYDYDRARDLRHVEMPSLRRAFLREKARCMGLLRVMKEDLVFRNGSLDVRSTGVLTDRHEPEKYRTSWRKLMGIYWEQDMALELDALRTMVEYIQDQGASVHAVMMPIGSWHADLPFATRYLDGVTEICESTSVPLSDFSGLLEDDEFADHSHAKIRSAGKCNSALMRIATEFLGFPDVEPTQIQPPVEQ